MCAMGSWTVWSMDSGDSRDDRRPVVDHIGRIGIGGRNTWYRVILGFYISDHSYSNAIAHSIFCWIEYRPVVQS